MPARLARFGFIRPVLKWTINGEFIKMMTRIYNLADDNELITKVQHATLTTEDFGNVPEIALYGTKDWWQAINDGRISRYVLDGVISDVFTSGESKWPQFEINCNGIKTVWTRFGNPELYEIGQRVKLVYVIQRPKKSWTGDPFQKEVLSIDIELNKGNTLSFLE
jgi:hypothetical protein